MKKRTVFLILAAAVVYCVLFVLLSTCGLIHPVCYAYAGTAAPLLFAFVYLYAAANMQRFGAALALNGFVLLAGLIAGEGNIPFAAGMIALAVIAELVRKKNGYDTIKGVRRSFLPFAFSFYAYSAHWWTDTAEALREAAEEMPAGYAEKMGPVISNIPVLVLMLALTVPMALLGIRIAGKVLKKQVASLKSSDPE